MNTWKVILATMVIFGTGVVTGGLLVRYSQRPPGSHLHRTDTAGRPAQPVSAGGLRLEFLRRMERELELSREQRERIDKLIKESQERSKKIMEPVAPKLREELQKTKEQFVEALTPEQRARFDELWKQQQLPREQHHPANSHERGPEGLALSNATALTNETK